MTNRESTIVSPPIVRGFYVEVCCNHCSNRFTFCAKLPTDTTAVATCDRAFSIIYGTKQIVFCHILLALMPSRTAMKLLNKLVSSRRRRIRTSHSH